VSDLGELGRIVDEVVLANPRDVSGFKAGKERLLGFFVGEVMKKTGGKANPAKVNELLEARLAQGPMGQAGELRG
jgi:aspartyl-tRNA(Asn)/glutamyl-tRNA(Gln) amidotransferase subunit B